MESGVISKTVDKKRDLRTFCRWSNLSRFTRFWGDQSDHKFAVGGPQLILRAGGSKAVYKLYKKQEKWYVVPSLNHGSILIAINTQMDM